VRLAVLAVALASLALAACPSPSPSGDGGSPPATTCSAACESLAAAGCLVGKDPSCPSFLSTVEVSKQQANPATSRPVTCADVVAIKTRADAQRLGFVCAPYVDP
jgi:hypothetical protein